MSKNLMSISGGASFNPSITPSNPVNGDVYYDSSLQKFRGYQSGAWIDLGGSSSGNILTGMSTDYVGTVAPSGYVLASGKTIGNVSSGATERANADTLNLFTLLWESYSNTELIIQDSAGSPTTRGASAGVDFVALKRLPTPDSRGRVSIGKDNMGGTAANRITSGGSGIVGATLGAAGGLETHTLITAQMPQHTHIQNSHPHSLPGVGYASASQGFAAGGFGGFSVATLTTTTNSAVATNQNAGSGTAHNNTQPGIVYNKIIKL